MNRNVDALTAQCMLQLRVTCHTASRFKATVLIVFFFKQKTAYEMRISDWSSDVCSSDLPASDLPQGKFPILLLRDDRGRGVDEHASQIAMMIGRGGVRLGWHGGSRKMLTLSTHHM